MKPAPLLLLAAMPFLLPCYAEARGRQPGSNTPYTAPPLHGGRKEALNKMTKEITPLKLHPENPHYFLFRGRPTLLVTSGEHYGAVINSDFDDKTYLDTLHADGLNLTRLFTGAYLEPAWAGEREQNTLAPRPGRLLAPWARSTTPGYAGGGNKFDLGRWDDAYFRRLKDFCRAADQHGVVVEVVFFSQMYDNDNWHLSPLYIKNNVNGVGDISSDQFTSLQSSGLVARQEALIRKITAELHGFENVYYELSNEPFSPIGTIKTRAWLNHLAATVVAAEATFSARHLISVQDPTTCDSPTISIYNFHYAHGDTWVGAMQGVERFYGRNKVLAFDETETEQSSKRRQEAWAFLLSGGAVYDLLDTSFGPDDPAGKFRGEKENKPVDGPVMRRQIGHLRTFIESFDFLRMHPARSLVTVAPKGATAYALAEPGRAYAIYFQGGSEGDLTLDVPAGHYRAEWVAPETGAVLSTAEITHQGGQLTLPSPPYSDDLALRLVQITSSTITTRKKTIKTVQSTRQD